jgi:hypothetical protein
LKLAKNIDEVIATLESIIQQSQKDQSPHGYFAALYQKVTIKVKEGINNGFFENGPRMEALDVIFANRYLAAYMEYQSKQPPTLSWQKALKLADRYWPIVLQHLLIGMNAHISLDLGIAAAEISKGKDINDLEADFKKINEVLSSLVNEVQNELAEIWPTLHAILRRTKKVDDFLVDFSMEIARDGAWRFAKHLAASPVDQWDAIIEERDAEIANRAKIITNPGVIVSMIFGVIRLGERGSVAEKVSKLVG